MAGVVAPPSSLREIGRSATSFQAPSYYEPTKRRFGTGQGKTATTILADQGDYVAVITDVPYIQRSRTQTWGDRPGRGLRPMHRTTLTIPTQDYTDYNSTMKKVHAATRALESDEVAHPYPSQHLSKINFAHRGQGAHLPWHSQYKEIFIEKPTDIPRKLHYPTFENKLKNTDGGDVRRMLNVAQLPQPYVTQYARIHDKLGILLGPGVTRETPIRRNFNILTGEDIGSAWQPANHRISGNRILYNQHRKDAGTNFVLG